MSSLPVSRQRVSRRSVARGAAWSVPLVAVSVAAPAFAASVGSAAVVTGLSGCRCGTGGGTTKPYRLDIAFTNGSASTFSISNVTINVSGTMGDSVTLLPGQTNTIPAGTTKTLRYRFTRGSNPTSDTVTVTYTRTNTTTLAQTNDTFTASVTWGDCTVACG